jgi:hypothetical protein
LRYCLHLSRRLKKSLTEILELSQEEINLQLAFDISNTEEFQKQQQIEQQREEYNKLSKAEKRRLIDEMFKECQK